MGKKLEGQVAIITGASSGIGAGVAMALSCRIRCEGCNQLSGVRH